MASRTVGKSGTGDISDDQRKLRGELKALKRELMAAKTEISQANKDAEQAKSAREEAKSTVAAEAKIADAADARADAEAEARFDAEVRADHEARAAEEADARADAEAEARAIAESNARSAAEAAKKAESERNRGWKLRFTDMQGRNTEVRDQLKSERRELEIRQKDLGLLPQHDEDRLKHLLNILGSGDAQGKVVDPHFLGVQSHVADISGNHVENHHEGLLPSQHREDPSQDLTGAEKQLAVVYGLLELDGVTDPSHRNYMSALSKAVGEFASHNALFSKVLAILRLEGRQEELREDHVRCDQWAQVVRALIDENLNEDSDLLKLRVQAALSNAVGADNNALPSALVINLPDLDAHSDVEIRVDNLHAMQAIYFSAMLDELRLFQVVDKLAELFQYGMLPIGKGNAGDALFLYWKTTSQRISEAERRNLYARALGAPGGDSGPGNSNREFNDVWIRFISAVSSYVRQFNVDSMLRANIAMPVNQEQVRKSGRDLAANLSLHGFGIAYFVATELQTQINGFITLLSDPDIKSAYGARDMWGVVDQVATLELGGARNSIRYRTMATAGAVIIRWLASRVERLTGAPGVPVLNLAEIRNPPTRALTHKPTSAPTDYDLVNAVEQWLAVTGTQDAQVEQFAEPVISPITTSQPVQIPSIARDMLDSIGIKPMA
jgi:hypothetical protein